MDSSSPRHIRRRLRRIQRLELSTKNLQNTLEIFLESKKPQEAEILLRNYREARERLREIEITRQSNLERRTQQDEATLKRLRDEVNSLTVNINELDEILKTLKGLREVHRDSLKKIGRLRYSYLRSIIFSNIYLVIIALALISSIRKSGIFTAFILFVVSGGAAARVIGVIGILIIGSALYWLRSNWRRVYAATEISIALVTAWVTLKDQNILADPGKQLTLAGAVYLIVRALDNFMQGQKTTSETKKRKKPSTAPLASAATVSHLQSLMASDSEQSQSKAQTEASS